tara:strand:+ start:86 stop:1657 length:1572 start_codon:yes stop_codon:yes gene_type:complete
MATDASRNPSGFAQMKSLFKVKDIKKVIKNTKMLGTGFWQVFYNANHTKIIKVNNIKTKLIRSNRCAENGEIEGYWFCQDWSDTRENEPKLVPAFGTSKESVELLAVGEESIDLKYYNEIDYEGALKYCVLEEEISDYLINEVANNFSGTKIVNFNNGGMSEEQQRQLANKVKHQLTGANGDKLIVSFNSGAENETTISDVPLNDAPAHYEYLSKEAQSKILNAHNVVSPYIVGITPEGQGFSSSADEIETANLFFHNGTISPLQDIILDSIKAILTFNGINLDVFFGRVGALYIGKDAEAKVKENEKQELSASIESLGEVMSDDWELIGDSEVDYDTEDELNANLESANIQMLEDENKTSLFGKIVNFATTGTANPNAKSAQDKTANGQHFKVRYKYTGAKGGERDFCNLMLSSGKVYRKEDIIRMGSMAVNAGFGENGADTYSIWLYKGGPRCHCKWNRLTFLSKSKGIDVKSPNASTVSRKISRKLGFDVINESKVSITPNNQPLKGFSPNNKNLPSDVK